jgi:hypothetical protein
LPETVPNGISARLWRLPGQLLLALINATAILIIVAAILALLALARIDNFAGNVTARMTDAVLSRIDLPSREVLANLRGLREDLRAVGNSLRAMKAEDSAVLQTEVARLRERMAAVDATIDRLTNARTVLTDEAIGQLGRSVTDTLTSLRGCTLRGDQTPDDRKLGDGAANMKTPPRVTAGGG